MFSPISSPIPSLLLPYPESCVLAYLVRRVKRFSVEVRHPALAQRFGETESGTFWAHCNNSGSMLGLVRQGVPCLLSPADNPKRKLKWTLEAVYVQGVWVGVNTLTPNRILGAAFRAGALPELAGYGTFTPEAKVGQSRLDGLFTEPGLPKLWVECKNVTLVEDEVAAFPDAATERGRKHLGELTQLVGQGDRAAVLYLIQRADGRCMGPADYVDAAYAQAFWESCAAGVDAWPYQATLTLPEPTAERMAEPLLGPGCGIGLGGRLPLAPRR